MQEGTHPMTSYIAEFKELIARMDGSQTYIQCFVDGLWDLRIKNIILVQWNEGSIGTISEAFDLVMEKETAYSNLMVMNFYSWLLWVYRKISSREFLVQSVKA